MDNEMTYTDLANELRAFGQDMAMHSYIKGLIAGMDIVAVACGGRLDVVETINEIKAKLHQLTVAMQL